MESVSVQPADSSKKTEANPLTEILKNPTKVVLLRVCVSEQTLFLVRYKNAPGLRYKDIKYINHIALKTTEQQWIWLCNIQYNHKSKTLRS